MRQRARHFATDERGAIAIIAALVIVLICIAVGGAVDFARYSSARSQTSAAIDTAVLAGARTLLLTGDATRAQQAASKYYQENIVDRFSVANDTIQFSITDNDTVVTGTGNAYLPTTFLTFAGIDRLPLVSNPSTGFPQARISSGGGGNVEVAVMLDLTGSMCADGVGPCSTGTKIDALKAAAKDLVNIVVQDNQSTYTSRVALVPFSPRIRVAPNGQGGTIMKALTNLDPTWSGWYERCTSSSYVGTDGEDKVWRCDTETVEYVSNYKVRPCVTERAYDAGWQIDYTDDAPGANAWLNGIDGRRDPLSLDSTDTPLTSATGTSESDPASHKNKYNYGPDGVCWQPESNIVQPLSADKVALASKIDAFQAEGDTAGALGTIFSWYMLSPKWASIWPTASRPGDYADLSTIQSNGKPKLRKVAVLMSDGVYNMVRNWKSDQQQVSNHAKQMCANMKAAGIEIYTVGFDLDSLPTDQQSIARDTLKSCGTDLEHFYETLDSTELQVAFRDIAVKLSEISLTR